MKEAIAQVTDHILTSAFDAGPKIYDLSIAGAEPWLMYESPGTDLDPDHKIQTDKHHQLLHHVKRLHLVFNRSDATTEDYDSDVDNGFSIIARAFEKKCLVKWLEKCSNLEELRLEMYIAPEFFSRVELK
ncbi:hypothetical protein Slin15195_G062520 [Septoria linicola]|uniref:Uncharacterized protein n=1 Tax=Septoria linicola TaxID=215465 RepID=A0A9Q9AVM2_9PEZI|nr:hypothetical protein Slin14017_G112850 [Septoria linicola]USW52933.1 hypothetical protein Slin15195_G062520 [Septoria linicola]